MPRPIALNRRAERDSREMLYLSEAALDCRFDQPIGVLDLPVCKLDRRICGFDRHICVFDCHICGFDRSVRVYEIASGKTIGRVFDRRICELDSRNCVFDRVICVFDQIVSKICGGISIVHRSDSSTHNPPAGTERVKGRLSLSELSECIFDHSVDCFDQ